MKYIDGLAKRKLRKFIADPLKETERGEKKKEAPPSGAFFELTPMKIQK